MTERNLPHEEQKEYKLWTKYFVERLKERGIPIKFYVEEVEHCEDTGNLCSIGQYAISGPNLSMTGEIHFSMSDDLILVETLEDVVHELITFSAGSKPRGDMTADFGIRNNEARLLGISTFHSSQTRFEFPYATGVVYNPKEVIDTLVDAFFQDYSNQRPGA